MSTKELLDEAVTAGVLFGSGRGKNGVAGERCVASTFPEKWEWKEEKEPRLEGASASAMLGLVGACALEDLGKERSDECSVASSSTAASSIGTPFVPSSRHLNPLYQRH